ncbi:MAG: hypothetical protein WCJ49_06620, partial [Deltaproteobacteria bacterium]
IQQILEEKLTREGNAFGFASGGVTFCSLLPMRSIPFKMICLLGMDVNAYPRMDKKMGFNLISNKPKRGDKSHRNDDKYLFLEMILSAREKLYISYIGQSTKDNSKIPPSVVVSDLIDYAKRNFKYCESKNIEEEIFTNQKLQGFSPYYFQEEKPLSYAQNYFECAQGIANKNKDGYTFVKADIAPPKDEWRNVSIVDLLDFFNNPAKFFLQRRLGIFIKKNEEETQDTEPLDINNLEKYLMAEKMLKKILHGNDAFEKYYDFMRAERVLPIDALGEALFQNLTEEAKELFLNVKPYLFDTELAPLEVDLKIGDFNICGTINAIGNQCLLRYRFAKMKAKYISSIWIEHLLMNCVRKDGYPLKSVLVAKDCGYIFNKVENASDILLELLNLYWDGLQKPLEFFPDTSFAYAEEFIGKKNTTSAKRKAQEKWEDGYQHIGEKNEQHVALCFTGHNPIQNDTLLKNRFEEVAITVFEPIICHWEKVGNY